LPSLGWRACLFFNDKVVDNLSEALSLGVTISTSDFC
jgi:hypothetical protein